MPPSGASFFAKNAILPYIRGNTFHSFSTDFLCFPRRFFIFWPQIFLLPIVTFCHKRHRFFMWQIDESTELQGFQLMRIYKKELLPLCHNVKHPSCRALCAWRQPPVRNRTSRRICTRLLALMATGIYCSLYVLNNENGHIIFRLLLPHYASRWLLQTQSFVVALELVKIVP